MYKCEIWSYILAESRLNSHEVGDGFDHLIMYALFCTLESEDESVMGNESICFGSLNEVMDEDDLVCLNVEKTRRSEAQTDRSTGRAYVAQSSLLLDRADWQRPKQKLFVLYKGF